MIHLPTRRRRPRHRKPSFHLSQESLEPRLVLDSTVVFNEIMYHPAAENEADLEWIEFYNQLAVDIDISDWSLEGGVDYQFPDGTIVPGRGHLILASNPEALAEARGLTDVFGPWTGRLSNEGEELRLYNNDGRLMNRVEYDDTGHWPAAPDGGGSSLAKNNRDAASDNVANWTFSPQIGGTPGRDNFARPGDYIVTTVLAEGNPARALVPSDASLGTDWIDSDFNDSGWTYGDTGVGFDSTPRLQEFLGLDLENPPDDQPPISMRYENASVYVRVPFEFDGDVSEFDQFVLGMRYDDGFVAYLNGVEVASANAPGRNGNTEELQWDSDATSTNRNPATVEEFDLAPFRDLMRQGRNVLAIQGMNSTASSGDVLVLPSITGKTALEALAVSPAVINEVAAADAEQFFVEIANPTSETIDLSKLVLRVSGDTTGQYALTGRSLGPGELLSLSSTQLGFRPADGDRILLVSADGKRMVDAHRVTGRLRGRSEQHDGQWMYPSDPTPGEPNQFRFHDEIVINEIMYHPMPKLTIPDTPPTYDRTALVPLTSDQWRYNATGAALPTDWAQQVYEADGTNWQTGQALLGYETSDLGVPINTEFTRPSDNDPGFITYYFQTNIEITAEQLEQIDVLELNHMLDDGAIFYLNGEELFRFNLPSEGVDATTRASRTIPNAERVGPISIPIERLNVGTNVLSAELHLRSENDSDVVFGAELIAGTQVTEFIPGEPFRERDELEWIELYNQSSETIDLSGWTLQEGIQFEFPANTRLGAGEYLVVAADAEALAAIHPEVRIVGNFSGSLSDHDDLLRLVDANKNLADEVHYYESGRWPVYPDGGAASLELKDPRADNNKAENWAASTNADDSEWTTHTFRGTAMEDVYGRALFHEFLFGLLSEGEFLIDDIRVLEDPSGAATELIQNGTFEGDTIGRSPDKWRIIGNHSGTVVEDPTQPGNKVLHVVATGAMAHVHDHAETTFANGGRIQDGAEYEISFRAKWLAGNSQLNSRLWFNRLSNTIYLPVPDQIGTPGEQNGAFETNVGPTFDQFRHGPTTPLAGQEVTVTVQAEDPDGVQSVQLWWRQDRQSWNSAEMTLGDDGLYQANIPGQDSGDVIQFYVSATDTLGASTTFPARGRDSRALYQVEDNLGPATAIDRFRLVMLNEERTALFSTVNRMSNWFLPVTVIHNNEPYYDVSVRQVGSRWIRPNSGYKVLLHPDKPFYGVHDSIRFDLNGLAELVMKQMLNRAGGSKSSNYDDIAYLVTPNHRQEIILQLARYENIYLNEQFENGSDGTKWELDDVTVPTAPSGGAEGLKTGTEVNQTADIGRSAAFVQQQGDNPEFYRAHLLIKSNRVKDDFQSIARLAQAIHQDDPNALFEATNAVMDVDLWMRHYAHQSYFGNWDTYGFNRPKNLRIYTRPSDNKFVPLFWDCDLCNFTDTIKKAVEPNSRLDEIRDIPHNLRLYWGHMLDMINRSFNEQYVARWATHYGELANGQTYGGDESWTSITNSTRLRSQRAISDMERDIPRVDFRITTNGGRDFSVDTNQVTLEGKGWVDVRQIRLAGTDQPLDAFWPTKDGWRIELPVALGANAIELEAIDYEGNLIGTESITVTSSVGDPVMASLRVTEVHYNPADPTAAEILAGYNDSDDFEFLELTNIGAETISLESVQLVQIQVGNEQHGLSFNFADGSVQQLDPGKSVLVVEDLDAFQYRYGNSLPVAGQWSGGLSNSSETITVHSAGVLLQQFTYDDGWHSLTDGAGRSLQIIEATNPDLNSWNEGASWRPSGTIGGAPGQRESAPGDSNHDGVFDSGDLLIVMRAGEYEDSTPGNSTFEEGDWNGDGDFNTGDLVWALTYGQYSFSAAAAQPSLAEIAAAGVEKQLSTAVPVSSAEPLSPQSCLESDWALQQRRAAELNDRHVDAVFATPQTTDRAIVGTDRLTDLDEAWDLDDLF